MSLVTSFYYRRKVMFLQVSVCPRGVVSQHALQVVSQHALQAVSQHALQVVSQHGLQQVSGGWYPSMHCRWYPSMPCNRSLGGSAPGGVYSQGGGIPAYTEADPPPLPQGETATAADGTHPTGMHSCFRLFVSID